MNARQDNPEPCCSDAAAGLDLRPVEGERANTELAAFAKAVAHPVRVRILRMLAHVQGCYCGNIASEFSLSQSTVSQHLKVLKDSGLIHGEIDGVRVCYCVEPAAMRRFKALAGSL